MAASGSNEFTGALKDAQPQGPFFIDTGGCGCALQEKLSRDAWRCIANLTENAYDGDSGKWYYAANQANPASIQAPENSDSNPPDTGTAYEIKDNNFWSSSEANSTDPTSDTQDIQDVYCTGDNSTQASAQFYQTLADVISGKDLPCWQPGTLPLQIQSAESWNQTGCNAGFFCEYNNPIHSIFGPYLTSTPFQVPTIRPSNCRSTAHRFQKFKKLV